MGDCTVPECRTSPVARFLSGWRCADHTPARMAGRAEPPRGPGWPAQAAPRPPRAYGTATSDPLGREGPGWKYRTRNWGLPSKVKDAAPADAH